MSPIYHNTVEWMTRIIESENEGNMVLPVKLYEYFDNEGYSPCINKR